MKVLHINTFGNLSTGRIACDLCKMLEQKGDEGIVAFARNTLADDVPKIKIGNVFNIYKDGLMTRITGKAGFFSTKATKELIRDIIDYNPDIIHLHNLHGYYINIKVLFDFLRKFDKPVVWTLHDCWAFTGHCCYYSMVKCNKWENKCFKCKYKLAYPSSLVDNSEWNFEEKKRIFLSLPKLTIVTVSNWLANEVSKSFLKSVPIRVIYNGVNKAVFKPTGSNFRSIYGLKDKVIILGVASTWDKRKGLDDFITLSKAIDERYQIVLVGLTKKQINKLPDNIIGLPRTNNVLELVKIYSAADVLFNPSMEETFGMTIIEAAFCGTVSIVYDVTACPEIANIADGYIVQPHNIDAVVNKLQNVVPKVGVVAPIKGIVDKYDVNVSYEKYYKLYSEVFKRV